MAKDMAKHYEARVRELKGEQAKAKSEGEQKRIEVTEYSGLIGSTLDLAAKIFPGYEAVKKVELPAPNFDALLMNNQADLSAGNSAKADNLTKIYNDYVAAHPEIFNPPAGEPDFPADAIASSTPATPDSSASSTPEQTNLPAQAGPPVGEDATTTPDISEPPAIDPIQNPGEPTSVEIIDLPVPEPALTPEPENAPVEPAPAPAE
jgi:hypothetical protein